MKTVKDYAGLVSLIAVAIYDYYDEDDADDLYTALLYMRNEAVKK